MVVDPLVLFYKTGISILSFSLLVVLKIKQMPTCCQVYLPSKKLPGEFFFFLTKWNHTQLPVPLGVENELSLR